MAREHLVPADQVVAGAAARAIADGVPEVGAQALDQPVLEGKNTKSGHDREEPASRPSSVARVGRTPLCLLAAAAARRPPAALHGQIQLHERHLEKHQERAVLVLLVEDEHQEENGVVCARASRLDAT